MEKIQLLKENEELKGKNQTKKLDNITTEMQSENFIEFPTDQSTIRLRNSPSLASSKSMKPRYNSLQKIQKNELI